MLTIGRSLISTGIALRQMLCLAVALVKSILSSHRARGLTRLYLERFVDLDMGFGMETIFVLLVVLIFLKYHYFSVPGIDQSLGTSFHINTIIEISLNNIQRLCAWNGELVHFQPVNPNI